MSPRPLQPGDSGPPRFTDAEREVFRQLLAVDNRVTTLAKSTAEDIAGLRDAFDDLNGNVVTMLQRDVGDSRALGALEARVNAMAAHTGGEVGGMVGAAAGIVSARNETKHAGAKAAVITMALSCITAVVVEAIRAAYEPARPEPPALVLPGAAAK
jgi:hypothetical protein